MDKDISEIIGWKCPCGQTGNMGKFCVSCGKVQPLVGAQRAVPEQIAATVEDKSRVNAKAQEAPAADKAAEDAKTYTAPVSAVSEYYDYSNEGANSKDTGAGAEEVQYVASEPSEGSKGLSIAGMVTGIVSCALFFVPVLGVASGITGMIMTIKAKDKGIRNAFTSTGTVCSAIGCAVGYLVLFRIFF
ncbi:MAG: hypothetical protein J6X33_05960 [Clostridiales bacterium]|nr:hypothetical protein [Clostridiales bacterium]